MKTTFGIMLLAATAAAQEAPADKVTVPFRDPSKPRSLVVNLLHGGITVKGYEGKEAVIEARSRDRSRDRRDRDEREASGLRRLQINTTGLSVEEENSVIKVSASHSSSVDLMIQVPVETSVKLRSVNDGSIVVDGISGEVDVNNVNGAVTVTNVSGSVIAHALNGTLTVTLHRLTPNKAMSFSTLNGKIDVTLPADAKANVKMKSDNGDIFTDFDIKIDPSARQPVTEGGKDKGRYKLRFDRAMYGAINGGGPEMQFTTLNGNIYIRQKK